MEKISNLNLKKMLRFKNPLDKNLKILENFEQTPVGFARLPPKLKNKIK